MLVVRCLVTFVKWRELDHCFIHSVKVYWKHCVFETVLQKRNTAKYSREMLSLNQHKVEMLVDEGYSVFVTGKGGSGKSFFLRNIIEKLRRSGDHCFVTAPTGIAATNYYYYLLKS